MAQVVIKKELKNKILKKFKKESKIIFRKMHSFAENPRKGKLLGNVGGIVIKELKYKSYRFYFITDGHKLKIMDKNELADLLIKFVRISDKKSQQEVINEIRRVLVGAGFGNF